MSTNAGSWFYQEPESQPYLIAERVNGTFWQARVVDYTWRCVKADPPIKTLGYSRDHVLTLEWVPGKWLRLTGPAEADTEHLVQAISGRVLSFPASFTYGDHDGNQITEWYREGEQERWSEIQGNPEYVRPQRLTGQKA